MRSDEAQTLIGMFGGVDTLARSLRVTSLPGESQLVIAAYFSECLFKRILLRVSTEHVGKVIDALDTHAGSGNGLEQLVLVLENYIPDMETCVNQEIAALAERFRLHSPNVI